MVSDQTLARVLGPGHPAIQRWGDPIRAASAVLAALVVAAMAVVYAGTIETTISLREMQDFGIFDRSSRLLRDGASLYEPERDSSGATVERPLNLNPPHFHLVLLALTPFAPVTAFAVWLAVSLVALVWTIALIRRALPLHVWGLALLASLIVVSPAMHSTLMTGQVGVLLLLPFTLAWLAARAGRDTAAGVWLGLCAGIKPFLLLFAVALIVQRRWRSTVAMGIAIAAMFACGAALVGVAAYADWIRQLGGVTWAEHYMNASLLGLLERTFSATPWGRHPLMDIPGAIRPLWVIATGTVCALTYLSWRSTRDVDRLFLMTGAAMLLVSPLGWVYYLWFLMPPLAALLAEPGRLSRREAWLLAIGLILLFVPPPLPWRSFVSGSLTATLGSIYSWGLLVLWAGARRSPRNDSSDQG
jgi:hypothetical protein